jgi:hypothetical protein
MASTTNYGFTTPNDSDPFKDGAAAMRELGQDVDTQLFTALGGTYPGLRLVKVQAIGSGVTSVVVNSAFSAPYANYKVMIAGGSGSTSLANLFMTIGGSTANYYLGLQFIDYATGAAAGAVVNNGSSFAFVGNSNTNNINLNVDVITPFLTQHTRISGDYITNVNSGRFGGYHANSTSYTGFTIGAASGTLSGGTIYVFGYGAT